MYISLTLISFSILHKSYPLMESFLGIFHPLTRSVASKKKNGLTEPINLVSGGCGNGILDFSQWLIAWSFIKTNRGPLRWFCVLLLLLLLLLWWGGCLWRRFCLLYRKSRLGRTKSWEEGGGFLSAVLGCVCNWWGFGFSREWFLKWTSGTYMSLLSWVCSFLVCCIFIILSLLGYWYILVYYWLKSRDWLYNLLLFLFSNSWMKVSIVCFSVPWPCE